MQLFIKGTVAPNELNYALPWLIMGHIKKKLSIQTRRDSLGQKTISRNFSFKHYKLHNKFATECIVFTARYSSG
jgi:hypothetical protein